MHSRENCQLKMNRTEKRRIGKKCRLKMQQKKFVHSFFGNPTATGLLTYSFSPIRVCARGTVPHPCFKAINLLEIVTVKNHLGIRKR